MKKLTDGRRMPSDGNTSHDPLGHWSGELKTEGAIKNGLSRDTGIVGYTRHKMKTNITQKHNTTQKTKKMSNIDPTKNPG